MNYGGWLWFNGKLSNHTLFPCLWYFTSACACAIITLRAFMHIVQWAPKKSVRRHLTGGRRKASETTWTMHTDKGRSETMKTWHQCKTSKHSESTAAIRIIEANFLPSGISDKAGTRQSMWKPLSHSSQKSRLSYTHTCTQTKGIQNTIIPLLQ